MLCGKFVSFKLVCIILLWNFVGITVAQFGTFFSNKAVQLRSFLPSKNMPLGSFISNDQKTDTNKVKCFTNYGCFGQTELNSTELYLLKFIPEFVRYPNSPRLISVEFFMFTCKQPFRPYRIIHDASDEKILKSPYDRTRPTVFIVHGFMSNYDEMSWMGHIKDRILGADVCKYNVVGVDWKNGANRFYVKAMSNTRMVSAVIHKFITKLNVMYNQTPDNFTMVGHSLGAHISGFVGERFKNSNFKLGKIIGLDPAGPGFKGIDNKNRLDPTDAKLVLTIHTNGGQNGLDFLGINTPLGHYSFFPNGGENQPGCELTRGVSNILLKGLQKGVYQTMACSHERSCHLMITDRALFGPIQSMGYVCENYEQFKNGKCEMQCQDGSDECHPYGSFFDYWENRSPSSQWQKPIRYFVDTSSSLPFSLFHYRIAIETGQFPSRKGVLTARLYGEYRDSHKLVITQDDKIEPNKSYTMLYTVPKDLGAIKNVQLQFAYGGNAAEKMFDSNPWIEVRRVVAIYMSKYNQTDRLSNSIDLRTEKDARLYTNKNYIFENQ